MEEYHIAVAHLVEHANEVTFTKRSAIGSLHSRDVADVTVVADGVVVDKVAYLLDQAVVADGDIAQGGIIDAGMLGEALGNLYLLLEHAETDVTIEYYTMEAIGREILSYKNATPVFCPAAVLL